MTLRRNCFCGIKAEKAISVYPIHHGGETADTNTERRNYVTATLYVYRNNLAYVAGQDAVAC